MVHDISVTLFRNGGQLVANLHYSAALLERVNQNYPNKLFSSLKYIRSYQIRRLKTVLFLHAFQITCISYD